MRVGLKNNQAGSTIIEVLTALMIISVVITGAYATASRSSSITRQSQERTQATKVAEQQIESIKSIITAGGTIGSDYFCIDNSGNVVNHFIESEISGLDDLTSVVLTSGDGTGGEDYPSQCVFNDLYHVHVEQRGDGRYVSTVRWERADGSAIDQNRMVYGID